MSSGASEESDQPAIEVDSRDGAPILGGGAIPELPVPGPEQMPRILESLLFVAAEPTPISRIAQITGSTPKAVEEALAALAEQAERDGRGLQLQRKGDKVQMTSLPEASPYIERFLGLDLSSKLSSAALETLAVIAYRQPLTRGDMEDVRGVNCDGVLRTLLARELVEPVGRLEQPGRPYVYGTTFQFLEHFGLSGLDLLPPLPDPIDAAAETPEAPET